MLKVIQITSGFYQQKPVLFGLAENGSVYWLQEYTESGVDKTRWVFLRASSTKET